MSVFGELASLLIRPEKDAGFEDTFASRFGAAPLDAAEAAALRQRQFLNRQQASGAERAERAGPAVLGGLADLSKSLGEPVTRITDYSRSRVGTQVPVTEEDVFRQDLASRNIGKGIAQAGAYGLPVRNPAGAVTQLEARGGTLYAGSNKAPPVVVQGIKAYHSSPHDFDKFDLSRIGTGEGAQAYGHGIYFAESPAVSGQGGQYWNSFQNRFTGGEGRASEFLRQANFDRAKAMDIARWNMQGVDHVPSLREYQQALELLKTDRPIGPRTYEVNINARPEQFLDWDRPIKDQPVLGKVRETIMPSLRDTFDSNTASGISGANAYRSYVGGSDVGASQVLRDYAGIPGIRYLDQGSRDPLKMKELAGDLAQYREAAKHWAATGNEQKLKIAQGQIDALEKRLASTSNYVVWTPEIIQIMRKYGLAGATAAPLGALAAQDNYRP